MGPYSRGTSHSTGAFFDMFYQHPSLMLGFVLGVSGIGLWLLIKNLRNRKSENQ